MLSKDGNRSGIKRKTPDKDWNKDLLAELPGGCCTYKSFGKLSNRHSGKVYFNSLTSVDWQVHLLGSSRI